jgi:preprotein translocase subunit YajC
MQENGKAFSAQVARWTVELVLVFIGVSAAFWLNNYQQHQQEAKRRDQILASLERTLRVGIESGRISAAKEEQQTVEFQRALDAGEMPPLHPFVFTTDYSPGDFATLLQSGGIEVLDVETLNALRNDESVIRWGLSDMAHYQKLSDELIVPNLDQEISFFYDPTTRKLRKRFEMYPEALQATVKFAHDLDRTHSELLKRIQAERHP